jgi:hypothetical protein
MAYWAICAFLRQLLAETGGDADNTCFFDIGNFHPPPQQNAAPTILRTQKSPFWHGKCGRNLNQPPFMS